MDIIIRFKVSDKQYKDYEKILQYFLDSLNQTGILNIQVNEM